MLQAAPAVAGAMATAPEATAATLNAGAGGNGSFPGGGGGGNCSNSVIGGAGGSAGESLSATHNKRSPNPPRLSWLSVREQRCCWRRIVTVNGRTYERRSDVDRGRRGAVGVRPAFSTFKVENAAPDGFRAIGTICAISCVLMLTYKKWQAAGPAAPRDAPQPLRAEGRPIASMQFVVNCCIHSTYGDGRRCAPAADYREGGAHRGKRPMPTMRPDCQNGSPQRMRDEG